MDWGQDIFRKQPFVIVVVIASFSRRFWWRHWCFEDWYLEEVAYSKPGKIQLWPDSVSTPPKLTYTLKHLRHLTPKKSEFLSRRWNEVSPLSATKQVVSSSGLTPETEKNRSLVARGWKLFEAERKLLCFFQHLLTVYMVIPQAYKIHTSIHSIPWQTAFKEKSSRLLLCLQQ